MAADDGRYVSIANWSRFQHYRDRSPPWIKLHNALLEDRDLMRLPESERWLAVGLMLLASRLENKIPADPAYLRNRLWLAEEPDLDPLLAVGFIVPWQDATEMLARRKQPARESRAEREKERGPESAARWNGGRSGLEKVKGDEFLAELAQRKAKKKGGASRPREANDGT